MLMKWVVVVVLPPDGRSLPALLITEGLACEYHGGPREGWRDGE